MDGRHFDALARRISSRRTALGGLLAGLTLLPIEAVARKKSNDRKRKGKTKQQVSAQDSCWRAGACVVSKGSNVSQCDLAGYVAPDPLDCTRCNLSRANLSGADLTGVNFTRANLSGACLVDANLSGATVTNTTNLYNAIFCRTTMPDGSINNSGCGSPTACCPTCNRGAGMTCGTPGNICCDGALCQNGVCKACVCTGIGQVCNAQGACVCAPGWKLLPDGQCGYPCVDGVRDCGPVGCPRCFSNLGVCFSDDSNFCSEGSCPVGQFCEFAFCLTLCGPPVGGPVAT